MNQQAEAKPRGRPRDPKRVQRVLAAAGSQFGDLGYERTSVDSIAQACGVSKATIYRYFPSKEALFDAVIGMFVEEMFATLHATALDPKDPAATLTLIGKAFLKVMNSEAAVKFIRVIYSAAGHHAAACEAFFQRGADRVLRAVEDYMRSAKAAGSLRIDGPDEAADQFLALMNGSDYQLRVVLGVAKRKKSDDDRLVKASVSMFLAAYGSGQTSPRQPRN
jgi:TetR/AcrR family transcriptional repressor of mexJK operon